MRRPALLILAALVALPVRADAPLRVQILTVTAQPRSFEYQLAGTIEPSDSIVSGFRDGGRILSVGVSPGDHLSRGDEIARVDPAQAAAARDAARATLAGAEAALVEARTSHDRVSARLDSGVATRAELDAATQALALAQGLHDQAQAQLRKASRAADDTVLRAPQDAIVTARLVEPGQVVGPGQSVVSLASDRARVAVFYAPDSVDVESFLGRPLVLTLIDRPEVRLTATLTEVSPVIDAATGTVRVKAAIVDPAAADPMLGAPVLGHMQLDSPAAIHLPWQALTASAQGPAVWTVDPQAGRVHLQQVTVTDYAAGEVTIGTGLTAGQQVVAAGSQLLYPGRLVVAASDQP